MMKCQIDISQSEALLRALIWNPENCNKTRVLRKRCFGEDPNLFQKVILSQNNEEISRYHFTVHQ